MIAQIQLKICLCVFGSEESQGNSVDLRRFMHSLNLVCDAHFLSLCETVLKPNSFMAATNE